MWHTRISRYQVKTGNEGESITFGHLHRVLVGMVVGYPGCCLHPAEDITTFFTGFLREIRYPLFLNHRRRVEVLPPLFSVFGQGEKGGRD